VTLTSLPVQVVKIDRSCSCMAGTAEGAPAGRKALEVVDRIVTLTTAYRLPTVAEGVVTWEQADLLTKAGCSFLEEYLFGRPEPLP